MVIAVLTVVMFRVYEPSGGKLFKFRSYVIWGRGETILYYRKKSYVVCLSSLIRIILQWTIFFVNHDGKELYFGQTGSNAVWWKDPQCEHICELSFFCMVAMCYEYNKQHWKERNNLYQFDAVTSDEWLISTATFIKRKISEHHHLNMLDLPIIKPRYKQPKYSTNINRTQIKRK